MLHSQWWSRYYESVFLKCNWRNFLFHLIGLFECMGEFNSNIFLNYKSYLKLLFLTFWCNSKNKEGIELLWHIIWTPSILWTSVFLLGALFTLLNQTIVEYQLCSLIIVSNFFSHVNLETTEIYDFLSTVLEVQWTKFGNVCSV